MPDRRAELELRCDAAWTEIHARLVAEDPEERAAAIERLRPASPHDSWTLTRMGAVLALVHAIGDPEVRVRRAALEALADFRPVLYPVEVMLRDAWHRETNPSLRRALERLVEHLSTPPWWLGSSEAETVAVET